MQHFISQLSHKNLQEQNLRTFQYLLLQRIILSAAILSFFIASSSLIGVYPLGNSYMGLLYMYSVTMALLYYASQKTRRYYDYYVQILIFFSLLVLLVMTTTLLHDTFRLVWFFMVVLTAFMLQGRYYGFLIAMVILGMVSVLYSFFDLQMNIYAFVTFLVSLSVFTLFTYYFVTKVRYDARHFEQRVEKEVEKRHSQEQLLLRQYRMQNMGEMIDAIAHQWRQPLMQSNMILMNMEEELDNKPYVEEKMQELVTLNTHMSQTIDDFRHLLHDSQEKITFNITKSIDEVRTLMKQQLKEIELSCQCDEHDEILGYKNELMQVFIILLSNAVEALKNNNIEEKKIQILTTLNERDVIIEIEDNAGGIEESVIDKIFDPYFSTKQSSGGTGLGLYIAKLITEETMHGKLSVTQGTEGAKFTITFKKSL